MNIEQLFKNQKIIKFIGDFSTIEITHLSCDTRKIIRNDLFFCLCGSSLDGHNFAQEAINNGAVALVVERPLNIDIPQIVVENARKCMSVVASNFYGNPREKLKIIGVTGTNGKTTTTYIMQSILQDAGYKVGVIGTIGIVVDNITLPAVLTTPDPIELHSIFAQMVTKKVDIVVMEVSAHAIYLNKIEDIMFDVGILTNITQDHLDYFKTFKQYKNTKLQFMSNEYCKQCVINIDDEICKDFCLKNKSTTLWTIGINNPSDTFIFNYKCDLNGSQYYINLCDDILEIKTKLIGKFNLYNALSAVMACKLIGVNNINIINGLKNMNSVAGRFNVIQLQQNKYAILDYAHTPDGLQNILNSVRQITNGKIISVFGCGGNRDKSKRAIMGGISANLADFTIITTDNPRFEKPSEIIQQIEQGAKSVSNNYLCIENRAQAIHYAISLLQDNDVAVICGKGAENYLDINGVKYPYSDLETILEENKKIQEEQIKI